VVIAVTAEEIAEGQGTVPGQGTKPDVGGASIAAVAAAVAAVEVTATGAATAGATTAGGSCICRACKGGAPRAWLTAGRATFGLNVCPL